MLLAHVAATSVNRQTLLSLPGSRLLGSARSRRGRVRTGEFDTRTRGSRSVTSRNEALLEAPIAVPPQPTDKPSTRLLSRRTLLKAAGTGLAATTAGWVRPGPVAAAEGLPRSSRFDLRQPSYDFFPLRNRPLHERHRIMQSLAFDNVNQRLFVAQLRDASSGDDLCVNQLDMDGRVVGHMHLDGVGHGVSIGVEAVGRRSFLWTEARSSRSDAAGRGTALQRFAFVDGQAPSDVRTFLPGSAVITCAVDQIHGRLLVRRMVSGRWQLTVHDLAAAADGDFGRPLTQVRMPPLGGTFQGYTLYGRYAYALTGTGQASPDDEIDSTLSCIDLTTGALVQRVRTRAGSSLVFREPEGLAVHRTPRGEVRLAFGMATRDRLDGRLRFANVFYKDVLVG